jgi:hypothetical protein
MAELTISNGNGNITLEQAVIDVVNAEKALKAAEDDLRKKRAIVRFLEGLKPIPEADPEKPETIDASKINEYTEWFKIQYKEIDKLYTTDFPIRGVNDLLKRVVILIENGKEKTPTTDDIVKLSRPKKRQILRKINKYCEYDNDEGEENDNARTIYITSIKKDLSFKDRLENITSENIKDIDERELDRLISIQEKLKKLETLK